MTFPDVKALTFDVYGTCVDVRGSLLRIMDPLLGAEFIDAWIRAYAKGFRGEYQSCDVMLQSAAYKILDDNDIALSYDSERSFFPLWRNLNPWADVKPGMKLLGERFTLSTLTNADFDSLSELMMRKGLDFDRLLTAEHCKAFKPDPKIYQLAVDSLELQPHEIVMVASHKFDLEAAAKQGFRTAFVPRPYEFGDSKVLRADEIEDGDSFDIVATDFVDLAKQLEAA